MSFAPPRTSSSDRPRVGMLVVLAVIGVFAVMPAAAPAAATPATTTARVVTVVDGDSIKVRERGKLRMFVLTGVDAPEGFACGAKAARDALAGLLPVGAKVRLRRDRAARSWNRYVFRDSRLVNVALVRSGYAVVARAAKLSRRGELEAAQRAASSRERGLWSSCKPFSTPAPVAAAEGAPGAALTGADAIARARAELSGVLFAGTASSGIGTAETRLHLCGDGYAALDTILANRDLNLDLRNRIDGTWEVLSAAYAGTTATAAVRLSSGGVGTTVTLVGTDGRYTIDGAEVPVVLRSEVCVARPGGA